VIQVFIACDQPGCETRVPVNSDGEDVNGELMSGELANEGATPYGYVDDHYNAPKGWTVARDLSHRCPEHS
jgi:hypothetical protein